MESGRAFADHGAVAAGDRRLPARDAPARVRRVASGRLGGDVAADAQSRCAVRRADATRSRTASGFRRSCRRDRPNDTNNVAPRLGFAYGLTASDGGSRRRSASTSATCTTRTSRARSASSSVLRRRTTAGPISRRTRGTVRSRPTSRCSRTAARPGTSPGCLRRELPFTIFGPNAVRFLQLPGVDRHAAAAREPTASVEADYVSPVSARGVERTGHNINLSYNPATGANYPFSDISRRPYPEWGRVDNWIQEGARSNYHALSDSVPKRSHANGWQASGTYLLSADTRRRRHAVSGLEPVHVPASQPDFGGEYSLAAEDQRHRAVFNGIWQVGIWVPAERAVFLRLRPAIRHQLRHRPAQRRRRRPTAAASKRYDRAAQRLRRRARSTASTCACSARLRSAASRSVAGIIEAFNLFDRANYGNYTTQEVSPAYGRPVRSTNVAYQPRMLQLGFRFVF